MNVDIIKGSSQNSHDQTLQKGVDLSLLIISFLITMETQLSQLLLDCISAMISQLSDSGS